MSDMFIKIDGIAGESQDEFHGGEIEVTSWHWKMAQQSSMMPGPAGEIGKATVGDIEFIHNIDRASPNLMRYCLTGRHIPKVVLTTRKSGGLPVDFLKITLNNVIITSVQLTALSNQHYESVSLSFSKVNQEYTVQNRLGGSGGMVTATFDIKENRDQ